ncbi:MAG: hypothetical protein DRI86_03880 [Bacteroidetes bacterium]|nr:MAG: hypothetical protein DRI86_03880 [Bacteroidota bacterium]
MGSFSVDKLKIDKSILKDRLDLILVDGQANNGGVKVVVDGNRKVRQVLISQETYDVDNKENLEVYIQEAVNLALAKISKLDNDIDY